MRIVLQKVLQAQVVVENETVGEIGKGALLFLGIHKDDHEKDIDMLIKKILEARIFPNNDKHFDQSLSENNLDILVVSQFTLFASLKKGRRPSFDEAASPEKARSLYEEFIKKLKNLHPGHIASGVFQSHMEVSLVNDGPVTFIYDSFDL